MRRFIQIVMPGVFMVMVQFSPLHGQTRQFYNVLKYGAKNDSSRMATIAIRNAIEAASEAGGGTIYFPAGKYLTGVVEDIRVNNVIMKNIRDEAIVLNMFYQKSDPEPVSERTPQFRNIHFSNITAQTDRAVRITGIEEMPVEDITFHDIQFNASTGIEIKEAKNIELHNVRITTASGPALLAENVNNMEIDGVQSWNPLADTPVLLLKNTQNVFLHSCFPPVGTETFLELQGNRTKHVVIKNNNFLNVKTPIKKDDEVMETVAVE